MLLRVVAEHVVVPLPVMEELLVRGPEDISVRAIRASPWIELVESPHPSEALLAWDLYAVLDLALREVGE